MSYMTEYIKNTTCAELWKLPPTIFHVIYCKSKKFPLVYSNSTTKRKGNIEFVNTADDLIKSGNVNVRLHILNNI